MLPKVSTPVLPAAAPGERTDPVCVDAAPAIVPDPSGLEAFQQDVDAGPGADPLADRPGEVTQQAEDDRDHGRFGLVAMAIFLALLVVGFIYEWKKGALEWD